MVLMSVEPVVLRKQLERDQVASFFARLEPCLIGIEACGGPHYWANKFSALGYRMKMMPPQFVKPDVKLTRTIRSTASMRLHQL